MGGLGDLHRTLNGDEPRYRPPSTNTTAGRQATAAWLDGDGEQPADERGRLRRWWDQDPDEDGEPERACSCEHQRGCEAGLYRPPSLAARMWRAHRRRVKARKAEQRPGRARGGGGGRR